MPTYNTKLWRGLSVQQLIYVVIYCVPAVLLGMPSSRKAC